LLGTRTGPEVAFTSQEPFPLPTGDRARINFSFQTVLLQQCLDRGCGDRIGKLGQHPASWQARFDRNLRVDEILYVDSHCNGNNNTSQYTTHAVQKQALHYAHIITSNKSMTHVRTWVRWKLSIDFNKRKTPYHSDTPGLPS
jgi:hypothetical protein